MPLETRHSARFLFWSGSIAPWRRATSERRGMRRRDELVMPGKLGNCSDCSLAASGWLPFVSITSTWQCNNAIWTGLVGICPCALRQRISPQAPQTLPLTPFWTVKSQFYADFGLITDIRCSLCKFLQPEPSLWAASVLVSPQITYTRTRGNGV
jgi:hypothetical protein